MKKIIIAAVLISVITAAFFILFTPHDMSKNEMLKAFEENKSSYENVGEYFRTHTDSDPKYVYSQEAGNYAEIKDSIEKSLENGFLYIGVSSDHREITFGTASQGTPDDHKLLYSPYDKPKSEPNAEMTKYGGWYIKM